MDLWQKVLAVEELTTPLVVVHRNRLERNVAEMAAFAREHGVRLRPHVKTHKTVEIAEMQRKHGAVGLTCAKLGEAEVFAERGFQSLLVAYPIVGKTNLNRLCHLIELYGIEVQTLVDSLEHAEVLSERAVARGVTVPVWVKVDSGLHRVGVKPGELAAVLVREARKLSGLRVLGLLTHAGHSYAAETPERVREIGLSEAGCLLETARLLQGESASLQDGSASVPDEAPLGISVGSTPTVRISGAVPGVTEIRPGNYVFNDVTQIRLGAAAPEACALRVFARVVSRPEPGRLVIDAGAKTLALDRGAHGSDAVAGYGRIVGHEDAVIERLSEEHGVVRAAETSPLSVGDVVEIIPNHACPVANLTDELFVVDDHGEVGWWTVAARGKTR